MAAPGQPVRETTLGGTPLRDLGLSIAGTPLETVLVAFQSELERVGLTRVKPDFYLSTEWGVPFGTVSVAIPFYLARVDLTALHARRFGLVEGASPADVLRYLRHEMGHVLNYAYQLYEQEEWVRHFGPITRPYLEEYQPRPFSRDYVVHLPGWYAQKHPDEDWAETFAVWMTPGRDWRAEYATWPTALAKLEYCDRTVAALRRHDPPVTATERDEEVSTLSASLDEYYRGLALEAVEVPGLDGALQTIFEDLEQAEQSAGTRRPAADLIRRLERPLQVDVYRWTGHFPERTGALVRRLAERADQLGRVYAAERELDVAVALTAFVTALAMSPGPPFPPPPSLGEEGGGG
jgi:hypothetical protein